MKGLALKEGPHRREFEDVVWQIADKRGCDEVAIQYECGHALWAEVWAPTLPLTREYGLGEAERRRFMQHSLWTLTREASQPRVQITVPEGPCRLCARGQRQTLICGPLQMDLLDSVPPTRRLELPMSSHAFLAVMSQVCRLPEGVTAPPISQGKDGSFKPFDGPPVPHQQLGNTSRKQIEAEITRTTKWCLVVGAVSLVVLIFWSLTVISFSIGPVDYGGRSVEDLLKEYEMLADLRSLTTPHPWERRCAGSSWALSVFVLFIHRTFGPESTFAPVAAMPSWVWDYLAHPLWILVTLVLTPFILIFDHTTEALSRIVYWSGQTLVLRPATWLSMPDYTRWYTCFVFLMQTMIWHPITVLYQIPVTNPLMVAMLLSLLIAAVSSPQPPSVSLPSLWNELPGIPMLGCFDKVLARIHGSSASSSASASPCFVCLERPSRYVLEPCGHRVVCGECTVQLVEAAARNRSLSDGGGGGGACPSCGMAISRAMRLFT
mmetsp:Transcript_89556/g.196220  ORF Transcript_89556/g.196220 Transcript_89556/m.196220 type:complete len:492 (+) Transcript_89556:63-1538(+)